MFAPPFNSTWAQHLPDDEEPRLTEVSSEEATPTEDSLALHIPNFQKAMPTLSHPLLLLHHLLHLLLPHHLLHLLLPHHQLHLLPHHQHINQAFHQLAAQAVTPALQEICNYISSTWTSTPLWPTSSWSAFMRNTHTNNDVEGCHC